MVVTSAVILHNPAGAAERHPPGVLRVARRFAAHNEETELSYNRYGYDTAAWYRRRGIALAESGPIPMDPDPTSSQFCVAVLTSGRTARLVRSHRISGGLDLVHDRPRLRRACLRAGAPAGSANGSWTGWAGARASARRGWHWRCRSEWASCRWRSLASGQLGRLNRIGPG